MEVLAKKRKEYVSKKKLFISSIVSGTFLILGISGLLWRLLEYRNIQEQHNYLENFMSMCFILLGIYFFIFTCILVKINSIIGDPKREALCYALQESKTLLSFSLSGIGFSFVIRSCLWIFQLVTKKLLMYRKDIPDCFMVHDIALKMLIEVFSIILGIFVVKKLFMSYTAYLLRWVQYKTGVISSRFFLSVANTLESIVDDDLEDKENADVAGHIFWKITGTEKYITYRRLSWCIGEENATAVFGLFDENLDSEINESEFRAGYARILEEKKRIQHTTHKKESVIRDLDRLLTAICYILSFFSFLYCVESGFFSDSEEKKSNATPIVGIFLGIITLLLSTVTIYGKIFSSLTSSICYIFFVRPFDIGDLVRINGVYYTVHSFGLINTLYKTGEKHVSIPNDVIASQPVENLSRSLFYHGSFSFTMTSVNLVGKIDRLRRSIFFFLHSNKKFKSTFYLGHFSRIGNALVSMELHYILTCTYKDKQIIIEREDELKLFIYTETEKISGEQEFALKQ